MPATDAYLKPISKIQNKIRCDSSYEISKDDFIQILSAARPQKFCKCNGPQSPLSKPPHFEMRITVFNKRKLEYEDIIF